MANILFYDIETAPILGVAWSKYETTLVWIVEDWYMLSFAWKWGHEKKTHILALPDFPLYQKEPKNDWALISELHELFNKADIVVAHNGDRFDNRKSNARFLKHNIVPTEPYHSIDTLKVARRQFALTSYKLDDLAEYLGLGRKLKTDKDLWESCMAGDPQAWAKMRRYNKRDVVLLEKVYLKLRPWIANHPGLNVINGRPDACPKCGGQRMHKGMKYRATNTNLYQYYRCMDCGGMAKARMPEHKPSADKMKYVN